MHYKKNKLEQGIERRQNITDTYKKWDRDSEDEICKLGEKRSLFKQYRLPLVKSCSYFQQLEKNSDESKVEYSRILYYRKTSTEIWWLQEIFESMHQSKIKNTNLNKLNCNFKNFQNDSYSKISKRNKKRRTPSKMRTNRYWK